MRAKKQILLLMLTVIIIFSGCGQNTAQDISIASESGPTQSAQATATQTPAEEEITTIPLTDIQKENASYVSISDAGTYNKEIITDELLSGTDLPEATAANIPYWTGFILENKISVNYQNEYWNGYREAVNGTYYFTEQEIAWMAQNGFNCARVVYSMSFLTDPDDINQANVAELEQLDELISWGLKYNVHIMLSITGMPGKQKTSWEEEGVQNNPQIFEDEAMQRLFSDYWDMLAKRYAEIPANVLSFELLAEPQVPDGSLDRYYEVLAPVATDIWTYNPDRIVIVNDVWKQLPDKMAEIGCCISLHTHIYTVDGNRLKDKGIDFKGTWPLQYLPESYSKEESGVLTLTSEKGFGAGVLKVYYEYSGNTADVLEDGKKVSPNESYDVGEDLFEKDVDIAEGTKEIKLKPGGWGNWLAVSICQEGKEEITIPTHSLYGVYAGTEPLPSIEVHEDGSLGNIDEPQKVLNADYFENAYLKTFMDCAKENNVSFLMTEIGTDTTDLTPEEYTAYHSEWLKALEKNKIPWMYNCIHNIFAPNQVMYLNADNSDFMEFQNVKELPQYEVNTAVLDMLKAYQD